MMWLIISQVMQVHPFVMQKDVNRLAVEIRDEQFSQCQECINELMESINQALKDNIVHIGYSDIKSAIYIKLVNYREEDSLIVVKVLGEKGVSDYVVYH